jgi:hypothetical protein
MPTLSPHGVEELSDTLKREDDYVYDTLGGKYIPRTVVNSWRLIPTKGLQNAESRRVAYRLNSFQNLYYFAINVLHKDKFQVTTPLSRNLHFQMCMVVMKDGLKEVIEIPRDHYKSTVYSECFPIWRALPFTNQDEDLMGRFGATPMYLEWMRKAHNQDIKIILVSEVQKNAEKLGRRTRNHYENNEFFARLFPEIIPDGKSGVWTNQSLHQKRSEKSSGDGEGTFDFIGVGGALQSTHYDLAIEDDLVGREALKSETVMLDTIEYHQLLAGAMDADAKNAGRDFDEIVVGNRWSYKDLNSHIRTNEQYFNFTRHSALGGCCSLHPLGEPIFPEAFSVAKLARYKQRFGTYFFSCQWLNFPINPERCKFSLANLRYFHYEFDNSGSTFLRDERAGELPHGRDYKTGTDLGRKKRPIKIRHKVFEGDVEEDISPRNLTRYMVVDPNHAGAKGRCRHAISITGVRQDRRRIYLLKEWAKACSVQEFVDTIFKLALAFKITTIHLETVAAQKYLKFHLEYFITVNRDKSEWAGIEYIRIADLKSSNTENAKIERIDSFVPITERKEFWVNADDCAIVREEMETYGNRGALIDLLDTLGYGTQVWNFEDQDEAELEALLHTQQQRFIRAQARA